MKAILTYVQVYISVIGGILGALFGGFDALLYALIAFVALDYVSGVLLAMHNKKLSSKVGFKGICKKLFIFIVISMGTVIDTYIIGSGSSLRTLLIMFYLSNEGISIIENAGQIGLPLPQKLKDVIEKLREKE